MSEWKVVGKTEVAKDEWWENNWQCCRLFFSFRFFYEMMSWEEEEEEEEGFVQGMYKGENGGEEFCGWILQLNSWR